MPVSTVTRSTDVLARVVDDNLNSWESWAGSDINIDVAYSGSTAGISEFEQGYWAYRGQAAMCQRTTDNAIVRVRIGDGSAADWTVYRQIITDPEDTSQWEAWTQVYTGTHYAIAIEPAVGGNGYKIITAKSAGLYVDNALVLSRAGIIRIKPTYNETGLIYYQTVEQDIDGNRKVRWWFTPDIYAGTPVEYSDCANYRWYRSDLLNINIGGSRPYYRFRSMAHELASRHTQASQTLTCDGSYPESLTDDDYDDSIGYPFNDWGSVRYLKGPSSRAGYKVIDNLYMTELPASPWDSAYYLFYNERHFAVDGSVLSNLKNPLFWSRSVGRPYYLSEPVPVGYSIWGFAGAVQVGDYIYLAGNGRVLRRPAFFHSIDLSDYLVEGDYEIPRDNQKSTGELQLANPDNILGAQLGMTDSDQSALTEHRLELAIGQKEPGQDIVWKPDNSWWLTRLHKTRDQDGKQRLVATIEDVYHRLENPFRDTIRLPGQLTWEDWSPTGANQLYNYFNDTDEFDNYNPVGADANYVPRLRTIVSGDGPYGSTLGSITLFAVPVGENGYVACVLWQEGGLVFRYQDAQNFYLVQFTPNQKLELIRYQEGVPTVLESVVTSIGLAQWLIVDFRWKRVTAILGSTYIFTHEMTDPVLFTGFVGTTCPEISNLVVRQHHATLTTQEILRMLLAWSDEHGAVLEIEEDTAAAEHTDLLWGPQSDLTTPEKAFRQLLDAGRLQTVWKTDE